MRLHLQRARNQVNDPLIGAGDGEAGVRHEIEHHWPADPTPAGQPVGQQAQTARSKRQVLHLQRDDGLWAVLHRIDVAEAGEVLLRVPRGCRALADVVHVKLAARHAMKQGKKLAIVTWDRPTRLAAIDAGVSVFRSAWWGRAAPWRALLVSTKAATPAPRVSLPPLPVRKKKRRRPLTAMLLALVTIGFSLVVFLLAVPEARINLTPAQRRIEVSMRLTADVRQSQSDLTTWRIPARPLTVEVDGHIEVPVTNGPLPSETVMVRAVSVVPESNLERARNALTTNLRQQATDTIRRNLGPDELLPPDSLEFEVGREVLSAGPGEVADVVGLSLRIKARAVAVDKNQIAEVLRQQIKRQVPAGFQIKWETVNYRVAHLVGAGDGMAQVEVSGSVVAQTEVDRETVVNEVRGQPLGLAVARLGSDPRLGGPTKIQLVPDWLGRVPWLAARIQVVVEER